MRPSAAPPLRPPAPLLRLHPAHPTPTRPILAPPAAAPNNGAPSPPSGVVGNVSDVVPPRHRFDRDLMGASRKGARDDYSWTAIGSDDEGSDADFITERSRSFSRIEVPFAVIALADELWALMLETDVASPEGGKTLAAALVATLPPPGAGSQGPDRRDAGRRASARASLREITSLGERDMVAIFRRVGRRAGAGAVLALRDFLDATGAGYPTHTPLVATTLLHVAALNSDDRAADAVVESMRADGLELDAEQWTLVATARAKGRRAREAVAALDAAIVASGGAPPDIVAASHIMNALEKEGTPASGADALALWRTLEEAGVRGNAFTHRSLVGAMARGGDVAGAVELAASLYKGSVVPPPVAGQLCVTAAAAGAFDVARTAAADMADPANVHDAYAATRTVTDLMRGGAGPGASPRAASIALDVVSILRPRYKDDWQAGSSDAPRGGPAPKAVTPGGLAKCAAATGDPDYVLRVAHWAAEGGAPLGPHFWARVATSALAWGDTVTAAAVLRASAACEVGSGDLSGLADEIEAAGPADVPAALAMLQDYYRRPGETAPSGRRAGGLLGGLPNRPPPPGRGRPPPSDWQPPPPPPAARRPPPPQRTAAGVEGAASRLGAALRSGDVTPARAARALAAIAADAAALPPGVAKQAALAAVEAASVVLNASGGGDAWQEAPPPGVRGRGRPPRAR